MTPEPYDENPYAAPIGDSSYFPYGVEQIGSGLSRDSNLVVARRNAVFPGRCVKCNAPSKGYWLKRQLYWHHPAVWFIVLVNPIIYVVVAMIFRKSAVFQIGLCPAHRSKRRNAILIGWCGSLVGIAVFFMAARQGSVILAIVAGVTMVGTMIYGVTASQVISPQRIDNSFAWIRGAGAEFLDSIESENGGTI